MRTLRRWTMAGLVLALAACSDAPLLEPEPLDIAFGIQPEPFRTYPFEATGRIDGRWAGIIGDPAMGESGDVMVDTQSSTTLGATVHLVQTWVLIPPDPIYPPDPIHPPDPVVPVVATMHGVINTETGLIVLNGRSAEGIVVHVRGETSTNGGVISVGGNVMFNPQPEPPGVFR